MTSVAAVREGRLRLEVRGVVQGVGFRPFVYRLARELGLAGFVENSPRGVTIEVEGDEPALETFRHRLRVDGPPHASIEDVDVLEVGAAGASDFVVRASERGGRPTTLVLPDLATCDACLEDLRDRHGRRYRYPFTNCTRCGPRYSIVRGLPYDRERTTMAGFTLCRACRNEYEDPADRRFHAEPNACPDCGPSVTLRDEGGAALASGNEAVARAASAVRRGAILAVQGLGGFHLVVDATRETAVAELRRRKHREAKPFAVMVPDLPSARGEADLSALEETLLRSPAAPIVIAAKAARSGLAPSVAPDNPNLGLLLPYTPLHHLLMDALGFPVVATSGNRSDEPICTDPDEAGERLAGIADVFLVHDRPIARAVEDSVVRVVAGRALVLRRARGYAPLPVATYGGEASVLAVGGHLKNTVALSTGGRVVVSPHVGDLETALARQAHRETVETLTALYEAPPDVVACDLHPDYASTAFARRLGRRVVAVQHHYAHVLAGMADNDLAPPVLGVAFDGTGYGDDGTVWGGEFLHVDASGYSRAAWLRPFPLPGGEAAVKEPRRSALGCLYAIRGDALFADARAAVLNLFAPVERRVLRTALATGQAPWSSSAGRLFDAVAACAGLFRIARFEGEAAMALEYAAQEVPSDRTYPFDLEAAGTGLVVDWRPTIEELLADLAGGASVGAVARRFHDTLAEMIVAVARHRGRDKVVLTGGCFQNRVLTERTVLRLRDAGFEPYWHRGIPPNDGGLAVGQALAVGRRERS